MATHKYLEPKFSSDSNTNSLMPRVLLAILYPASPIPAEPKSPDITVADVSAAAAAAEKRNIEKKKVKKGKTDHKIFTVPVEVPKTTRAAATAGAASPNRVIQIFSSIKDKKL